jgi:hypothetical protein
MGLLDDAIREHLDLKRRRGADPSEIAREESEALGPVRREAPEEEEPEAAAPPEPAALDEPAVAYDDEPAPAPVLDDEPELDLDRPRPSDPPTTHDHIWAEPEDESATPPHGDPLAHQATREFSATELGEALGRHAEPAVAPEPELAPEPEPPLAREPEPAPPAPAPAPYAEAAADDDADDDGPNPEDELDQTPDFLQETPEHDRLWFEQKPPKDFDF